MLRRTLATAAVLLAATLPGRANEVRPQDPTLEVHQGRAILVQRGSRGAVLYPGAERALRGECHLRVVAGGRAHLSWPGVASLRIEGPTEIAWTELELAGAALADAGSLEWSFFAVGVLELELRRPGPRITFPGGWSADPAQGAYRFSGGAGDRLTVTVRAGTPLALAYTDPAGRVRPPAIVRAGRTVELSPAALPRSRPDRSAGARPWRIDRVSWPWGAKLLHWPRDERQTVAAVPVTPDAPHVALDTEPTGAQAEPLEPEATPEPAGPLEHEASLERTEPIGEPWFAFLPDTPPEAETPSEARAEAPPQPPATPEALPEPEPEPEHGHGHDDEPRPEPGFEPDHDPEPSPEPAPFESTLTLPPQPTELARATAPRPQHPYDPLHWGGLDRASIRSLSFGELERAPGLAWTQLTAGLWRVEHLAGPYEPAWLFTRGEDVLLPAGSSVTFDARGRVLGFQGAVEVVPAPAARPRFDELEPPSATRERLGPGAGIRRRR